MKKTLFSLALVLVFSFLAMAPVLAAGNASLTISPASGSYQVGHTFNMAIWVNPNGETIDTVRAKLSYPADKLEIKSFSFGPVFTFQAGGNSYDNIGGTFSYGAGVANGTTGAATFGTIVFKVKSEGQATVNLTSDSLVLAAGESKFNGTGSAASFSLLAASPAPTPAPAQTTPKPQTSKPAAEEEKAAEPAPAQSEQTVQPIIPSQKEQSGFAAIFSGMNLAIFIIIAALIIGVVMTLILRARKNRQPISKIKY